MSHASLSRRLAEFTHRLTYDHLDEQTRKEVRRRVIDSFSCALGAHSSPVVHIARKVAARVSADPGATYLGNKRKTSPEWAAFVNGILFRYLDYNDTYLSLEPAHPSDNLAAVLAVAEVTGSSGKDVMTALVLAYEIQCRMCDAASIRSRGWDHVTYGAFSTSLAAGKLLGMDVEKLTQTVNIAGTPHVAIRQTRSGELSEWKGCAFANASRNGVVSALLANEGLTGPSPLFEGELGFFKQVSGQFELPFLDQQSPGDFMINRTSIKFWPAEYHSQSAIHAALEMRQQILKQHPTTPLEDLIASFDIFSFDAAVDIIGKDPEKWRPKTRETADHSLPYCTAVALLDGDVTLASFSDERLSDQRVLKLLEKIKIHRDDELTARYPRGIPNRLVAKLTSGETITAENEFPRGHDQNPMTDAEVTAKFQRMANGIMSEAAQNQFLETCWHIDSLTNVSPLISLFPSEPA
ncbi:MAG: MmgE/PrpD family protein [Planctomycetota bacterium]|nr:MmgE/PrpD family protein [Planctomycetota bacterium]MDA1213433.1 MmgE/PrpD family protein [Planctomycetota bacterium]